MGPGMMGPRGGFGPMMGGPRPPMGMGMMHGPVFHRPRLFGGSLLSFGLGTLLGSTISNRYNNYSSNNGNYNNSYNNSNYNNSSDRTYELYNYCPNCGAKRDNVDKFCKYCGSSLYK